METMDKSVEMNANGYELHVGGTIVNSTHTKTWSAGIVQIKPKKKVYLSGGMKSGWQDKMPKTEDVIYFDPRKDSPQNQTMQQFVEADIKAVKNSDVIFCYMEKDNPSGLGATWECAVAVENNIPVITVWEKDYIDPFFACKSLFLYNNFEAGVERLVKFVGEK